MVEQQSGTEGSHESKPEVPGMKKKPSGKESAKEGMEKESLGNDYWDRVADDVASGYESDDDENDVLNVDQEPHDNERGDGHTEDEAATG